MTFSIKISPKVSAKLTSKHSVTEAEVRKCFANIEGGFLVDDREDHRTDPPTYWFIAETDHGKKLNACFVHEKDESGNVCIHLKTAYPPNEKALSIYKKIAYGK